MTTIKTIPQLNQDLAKALDAYNQISTRKPAAPAWLLEEVMDTLYDAQEALWEREEA